MSESVFLCHSSADTDAVEQIALALSGKGLDPWLDKWSLVPGERFTRPILDALNNSSAVAVFVGPLGRGPWQNEEIEYAINGLKSSDKPIIPVLLPGTPENPDLDLLRNRTWVKFRRVPDDEDALDLLVCGVRRIRPDPRSRGHRRTQLVAGVIPYRGLSAYDVEDSGLFFGREKLIEQAVSAIQAALGQDCLTIVGESGHGKSSYARAGVMHALLTANPGWSSVIVEPGTQPLEALATRILRLGGSAVDGTRLLQWSRDAKENPRMLALSAAGALGAGPDHRLLLLVDQFEEVFAPSTDEKTRSAFIANIVTAARESGGQVAVIVCVRADAYGQCSRYPELAAILPRHQILVGPMQREELLRAITGPAEAAGGRVEPGLAARLADECLEQPSPLPMLQIVLQKLWGAKTREGVLTEASYSGMSFVDAIDLHAESVFCRLDPAQQQRCSTLFLQLVEVLEDGRFARRRANVEALLPPPELVEEVRQFESLLGVLSGSKGRLVTLRSDGKASFIEIAHETIFRGWKRLGELLDKQRDFLRWKRRLWVGMEDFRQTQDPACYLTGKLLETGLDWLRKHPEDHSTPERVYLANSEHHSQVLAARRVRTRAVAAAAIIVVVGVAGGLAYRWRVAAEQQSLAAAIQKQITTAAGMIRDKPAIAMVLALDAARRDPSAQGVLQDAVQHAQPYPPLSCTPNDVVFGDDGALVAAATGEAVLIWRPQEPAAVPLWGVMNIAPPQHELAFAGGAAHLSLSEDSGTLAAAGQRGASRIWETGSGREVVNMSLNSEIVALALDSAGTHVALGLDRNEALWWNVRAGNEEARLNTAGRIGALSVAPGKNLVAIADWEGIVKLWNPPSPAIEKAVGPLEFPTLNYVCFFQSGDALAIAAAQGKAWIWRRSGGSLAGFSEPNRLVKLAAMSRDGRRIATYYEDPISRDGNTISLWNAENGSAILTYHDVGAVIAIALDRTGRRMVVGLRGASSADSGIRIYDLDLTQLMLRACDLLGNMPADKLSGCDQYLAGGCGTYLEPSRRGQLVRTLAGRSN